MLIDIATASPPYKTLQSKATFELKKRMGDRPAIARLIDAASYHSGIESRYVVVPDGSESEDVKFYSAGAEYLQPDTKRRMKVFEKWSKQLTREAVSKLFHATGIQGRDVDRLLTVSCTGFFAPGFDQYLMEELGIPLSAHRTNIGFMGCAASIIGFQSAFEALRSGMEKTSTVLLVTTEICSLHLQTEPSRDNILSNLIFADGAAAVLFSNTDRLKPGAKLELLGTKSILFQNSSEYMGWKIGNLGFEMKLSSELPKIISEKAVPELQRMLGDLGADPDGIRYWALHPGGRAILDALQNGLKLDDEQMQPSRTVLRDYGNMSSVSILFVLKELLRQHQLEKNEYCCAVAFGPGLSMEVALLKGV